MQVLLAPAHEATVARLVSAVEAGGLQVAAVDLVPLALDPLPLARPISRRRRARPAKRRRARRSRRRRGHRVVRRRRHRDRRARGRRPAVRPRARHRWARAHRRDRDRARPPAGDRRGAEAPARNPSARRAGRPGAHAPIERPLSVLLDEVRSSIDYYRNQPGSSPAAAHRRDRWRGPAARARRAAVGARRRARRARAPARAARDRRHRVPRGRAARASTRTCPPPSASRSAAPASAPSSTSRRVHAARRRAASDRLRARSSRYWRSRPD